VTAAPWRGKDLRVFSVGGDEQDMRRLLIGVIMDDE